MREERWPLVLECLAVNRIAIIGSGGAGKSVFARELGARTGLLVIHLDRLF